MDDSMVTSCISRWPSPGGKARIRLFCFPYAGRGASLFSAWPGEMPDDIEICAIQLPGRENRLREPAFSSWSAVLDELVFALIPYLDRPYAFFGHSLGALIAFELACALQQRGNQPDPLHLFLSGCRAPHLIKKKPPLSLLPEAEFLQALRQLEGTPEEVLQNKDLLDLLMPLLRADFALFEAYEVTEKAPLPCPLTVFGGLQDKKNPQETLTAWNIYTSQTFQAHFFPGGHFFLREEMKPLLRMIARDLFSGLNTPVGNAEYL
jgi:medium-chain acyl-[acyl-carrier-protein] hydrolase